MLEGDLQSTPLRQVMQSIGNDGRTGILTIQGENDIVAVSFLEGEVVSADALNQTVEDGLGRVLVREKHIGPAEFEALASEHQGGSSGTLGDLLVDRGVVTRAQLLQALRSQTTDLMVELLSWEKGEFKFYGGDEVSYQEGMKPIGVDELLVLALEHSSGGGRGLPDVNAVYRQREDGPLVRVVGADGDGSGGGVWLSQEEAQVLDLCDGEQPAVMAAAGMGRFALQHALHRLLEIGMIEPVLTAGATSQMVGATEIFMPPDPEEVRIRREATSQASAEDTSWVPWIGRGLAALLAIFLGLSFFDRPGSWLLPYPWQVDQREAVDRQLRTALLQRIDRAARTHYLLEERFPDGLSTLVDLHLLAPADLKDPSGEALRYRRDDAGYGLTARNALGEESEHPSRSLSEDVLLSADFAFNEEGGEAPLVLLD